jgi:acetate kinase
MPAIANQQLAINQINSPIDSRAGLLAVAQVSSDLRHVRS